MSIHIIVQLLSDNALPCPIIFEKTLQETLLTQSTVVVNRLRALAMPCLSLHMMRSLDLSHLHSILNVTQISHNIDVIRFHLSSTLHVGRIVCDVNCLTGSARDTPIVSSCTIMKHCVCQCKPMHRQHASLTRRCICALCHSLEAHTKTATAVGIPHVNCYLHCKCQKCASLGCVRQIEDLTGYDGHLLLSQAPALHCASLLPCARPRTGECWMQLDERSDLVSRAHSACNNRCSHRRLHRRGNRRANCVGCGDGCKRQENKL